MAARPLPRDRGADTLTLMSTLASTPASTTPKNPFGNYTGRCIACGRDPGLRYWHSEGDLLCWPCWLRVEHLGEDVTSRGVVFDACRLFREGNFESLSGAEHDGLVALCLLVE
jgi:hypothetical protein